MGNSDKNYSQKSDIDRISNNVLQTYGYYLLRVLVKKHGLGSEHCEYCHSRQRSGHSNREMRLAPHVVMGIRIAVEKLKKMTPFIDV